MYNGEDFGGNLAELDFIEISRERRYKKLIGKYVIVCDYRGRKLYYQDRNVSRKGFWTRYPENAMGFFDKDAAERCCAGLKYNNPKVICFE